MILEVMLIISISVNIILIAALAIVVHDYMNLSNGLFRLYKQSLIDIKNKEVIRKFEETQ